MRNPETITRNIAVRFEKEYGRKLTTGETARVKAASGEALRNFGGLSVRKYITEHIGEGNGLSRFEDIATGKDTDIRRAVHKEVMECILELAGRIGTRVGVSAIKFVREWRDDYDGVEVKGSVEIEVDTEKFKQQNKHARYAETHVRVMGPDGKKKWYPKEQCEKVKVGTGGTGWKWVLKKEAQND